MLNKWIVYENKTVKPQYRIFLFHHAGGAASFYRDWKKYFGDEVQICPVQFPMRENRLAEQSPNNIENIVEEFIHDNRDLFDVPYILFGHSMGGITAYEVASGIEKKGIKPPVAVYVSSANEPNSDIEEFTDDFSDSNLKKLLAAYGLMEDSIISNEDFMRLYLPIARNDFMLCSRYHMMKEKKRSINSPIYVIWGKSDRFVEDTSVLKWKDYSRGIFHAQTFSGDHFYLKDNVEEISGMIKKSFAMYESGLLDSGK
ncbi:MAG: thioesterase [Pseudobutyrivibrio sp.]|uniref:thioesterase II family protein n=1 Tax=Pseudobutyrivibrio sp. TaxID=2014367 RepID=UPI0025F7CB99|nr:thioesterase domain-containing protein [Pseudobutyrivibrio sp.]MBQ8488780.1 thioesterase [Pseudobutyrivibrio sp.]